MNKEELQNKMIAKLNKQLGGIWHFETNVARRPRTRTTKSGYIAVLPRYRSGPSMETRVVNRLKQEGKKVAYRQAYDKNGNSLDTSKVIGIYWTEDSKNDD